MNSLSSLSILVIFLFFESLLFCMTQDYSEKLNQLWRSMGEIGREAGRDKNRRKSILRSRCVERWRLAGLKCVEESSGLKFLWVSLVFRSPQFPGEVAGNSGRVSVLQSWGEFFLWEILVFPQSSADCTRLTHAREAHLLNVNATDLNTSCI